MSNTRAYTISGALVDLASPSTGVYDIYDIAHGLSQICRWHGQCKTHFSVAQHSVVLSGYAPMVMSKFDPNLSDWDLLQIARASLLHDASEAYTNDVPQSVKRLVPEFKKRVEDPLTDAIFAAFEVETHWLDAIKDFDVHLAANEQHQLFFYEHLEPFKDLPDVRLVPQPAEVARRDFTHRYNQLFGVKHDA